VAEHRYVWDESTTCHYNDLSVQGARAVFEEMGCRDIRIEPLDMKGGEIAQETRITARAPERATGRSESIDAEPVGVVK